MATTNEHGLLRLGMRLQLQRFSLVVHLSISPPHCTAAVGLVSIFSLPWSTMVKNMKEQFASGMRMHGAAGTSIGFAV